jgi:hypothetical protein
MFNLKPARSDRHFCVVYRLKTTLKAPCLGKGAETAVVGLLCVRRKTTAGQLLALKVILDALAANALLAATAVGTRAEFEVLILLTFHG